MSIPTDASAQYTKDGFYLANEPILSGDIVERATAGMDAVRAGNYDTGTAPPKSAWNPGDDPDTLCKIELPQLASGDIQQLVSHPELGKWAAAVTGAERVQVWWVQLLYKPTSPPDTDKNVQVGWHQDRHYWQAWEEGSELFTAWVALSDVAEDAGPMRFARGSHEWGLIDEGGFYAQDLQAQLHNINMPEGAAWEETPALLPPGGASFHHCLTFHGSGMNVSGRPRRSLAIHMRTENSRPVDDLRQGLTEFIDDPVICPTIFGA